jgi:hypothetical protein
MTTDPATTTAYAGLATIDDVDVDGRRVLLRAAELTGAAVRLAPAVVGPQVRELTEELAPGEILMLHTAVAS